MIALIKSHIYLKSGFHIKTIGFYSIPILGFFLLSSLALPGVIKIKHFSKAEYGAASKNWCISSTSEGFVYFANQNGLLEFDGTQWELYRLPNRSKLRSVRIHSDQNIYTCGYEELGYWSPEQSGELKYHSLTPKVMDYVDGKNFEFWNISAKKDTLYFQSNNQILSWHNNDFFPINLGAFISVMNKVDGKVLTAGQKGIVYWIKNDKAYEFINDDQLKGKIIKFLLPYREGQLMIGTDRDGIYIWDGQNLKPWKEDWKNYFSKHELNRGYITSQGQLILGTLSDGILIFNEKGELLKKINAEDGLGNNTVLGIHSDRWNNIWLALDDGISFIPSRSNQNLSITELPGIGALYSTATYEDRIYLASNQGLYLSSRKQNGSSMQMIEGTQAQTWCCKKIGDQLLVGHNQGTFYVDGSKAKKISDFPGGFNFTEDKHAGKQLLQCTYSDLVKYKIHPDGTISADKINGFSDLILFIEVDHLGQIWASHRYKGVYKLISDDDRDSIISGKYYGEETFGTKEASHVFKVENRIVFTNGKRLYVYDALRDSILPYTKLNDKLNHFRKAKRIIPAPNHHYWFITGSALGLFQINNEELLKVREFPLTLLEDHQLVDEFENIEPITDKTAILSLRNAYAYLDATINNAGFLVDEFAPVLRKFEIYNGFHTKPIAKGEENIRIKHLYNNLRVSFSFPFLSADPLNFQYKIVGLDDHWSPRSKTPKYEFERLPKGKYKLQVKAIDSWGNESKIHETQFEVLAPYYYSKFAYLIYLILILLILLGFRNWAIKLARKKIIEQQEIREKEAIQLRNEKLRGEVSHKSRELANSTMALIRKNKFLFDLKKLIEKQKSSKTSHIHDKFLKRLNKKIDDNISSEDDWQVFEINFEQAHTQFFDKIKKAYPNLTKSDLKLCAYLRMSLSSKEIAPLMGITIRSVENHRYKLRKKLDLKHEDSLIDVILSI